MKGIKVLNGFLILLMLCLNISVTVSAESKDLLDYYEIYDDAEFQKIKKQIYNSEMLIDEGIVKESGSANEICFLESYKLYLLKDYELLKGLMEGQKVVDLISDKYVWIAVTQQRNIIRIAHKMNEWEVLGYSIPLSDSAITEMIDIKSANTMLKKAFDDSKDIVNVLCFEAPMYHTNFVYIQGIEKDYLIPFGSRPDLTGLHNGELYTPYEVARILQKSFEGVYESENNAGAVPVSETNSGIKMIIGVSVGIVVLLRP